MSKFDPTDTAKALESGTVPTWIADHLKQYVESGGREGHYFDSTPYGGVGPVASLLLTTVGRRSGKKTTMPLFYGPTEKGYVIIGSKGGSDTQPAWYHNLVDQPLAEVQVGPEHHPIRARVASGPEREKLWEQMAAVYPPYRDYQSRTTRQIPVVLLERI